MSHLQIELTDTTTDFTEHEHASTLLCAGCEVIRDAFEAPVYGPGGVDEVRDRAQQIPGLVDGSREGA